MIIDKPFDSVPSETSETCKQSKALPFVGGLGCYFEFLLNGKLANIIYVYRRVIILIDFLKLYLNFDSVSWGI